MPQISAFFLSEHIADLVLVVMAIEAAVLVWLSRRPHSKFSAFTVMSALLPGFFLALALRSALVRAEWFWIALVLMGALITHLIDMRLRLQSRAASSLNR